jgi:hypothetical protein
VPAAAEKPKTYTDEFRDRVKKIEADAHELGLNFTVICSKAGISRATPDRWKKRTPKTIALVSKMEAIVDKERQKQSKKAAATP